MPKHIVTCKYCGQKFDINEVDYIKPTSNRYAHTTCHSLFLQNQSKEEKEKEELFAYIKELFNGDYNYILVDKTIKKLVEENKYTYSGIMGTLHYFYVVKKNPIDKANKNIGIVPYVYEEAKNYYAAIYKANEVNAGKDMTQHNTQVNVIRIASPQLPKKKKKYFKFLEEEEDN